MQRNGYDYAVAQTGADVIEIGNSAAELEAAITDRTACIVWFAGGPLAREALPVEEVIRIARARGVPVIVDAAAQIPPYSNLWRFTKELGATGAIFSGGKGIRGPQSSGLVLGTKELIAGCRANGNPNHSLGRPMKVGKEELAGILAAVEYTLAQDETALLEQYEAIVHGWIEDLAVCPASPPSASTRARPGSRTAARSSASMRPARSRGTSRRGPLGRQPEDRGERRPGRAGRDRPQPAVHRTGRGGHRRPADQADRARWVAIAAASPG